MTRLAAVEIESVNLTQMQLLADSMIQQLPSPQVIGLIGTLGAGKTTLVQAIARAAGIDAGEVTSPTFTLLQTHQGKVRIHHLDAYRIADEDEFLELGVAELFDDRDAWTIIEWADRVRGLMPDDTIWIRITLEADPNTRKLEFSAPAPLVAFIRSLIADR